MEITPGPNRYTNEVYQCRIRIAGLPNHRLLKDRLQQAIAQTARQHSLLALVVIDLDDFKRINDAFGHAAGDLLLCAVAKRLANCIRSTDTACHYGGDEFIVMLPALNDHKAVGLAIQKIRECFNAPHLICGIEKEVRASIGCAIYTSDEKSGGDMINIADSAMYRAKARRKCRQRFSSLTTPHYRS